MCSTPMDVLTVCSAGHLEQEDGIGKQTDEDLPLTSKYLNCEMAVTFTHNPLIKIHYYMALLVESEPCWNHTQQISLPSTVVHLKKLFKFFKSVDNSHHY